ncbi:MFS transporter [Sphingobacterium lactis]|uniref:Predicted arabinose efflux permease, MFS family n=1 Tax=Sphingobacterium lactis TaxID=797291 RepID=A0A1H6CM23_9SPHI|nr:MFS transporter [Sphingobacterium lactis]SEG74021.1 Predicted arabinose efflux permease, MFS family [Sphingobacterium lactis]
MEKVAHPKLSKSLLWLMTVVSGVVVANNYYNQPLLAEIANEFQVSEAAASRITVLTQLGYACGLLMIIPLGDKLFRKRLILVDLIFVMLALIWMALSDAIWMMAAASFLIGFSSVIPQLFVPMVADLSDEENRSSNIGMVMSGLLMGILLSRFIGGIVGDVWGWRSIYWGAAVMMVLSWGFIYRMLPEMKPNFKGNYGSLMKSVWDLARTQPILQLAAFRGAMSFASLCVVFTTLAFHLEQPPFEAGPSVAGSFGLIGAAGALAAAFVGRLNQHWSRNKIIAISLFLLLISWFFIYFLGNYYIGLVIGIVMIDLGLQASHIMNQSDYFAIKTPATSRLNTVYMVSYFIGGSFGSWVGGQAWSAAGWTGVCLVGVLFAVLGLVAHLLFANRLQKKVSP